MSTLGRIVSFREYLLREDVLNGVILQYSLSLRREIMDYINSLINIVVPFEYK